MIASLAFAALLQATPVAADPLAPAASGQVQCYKPDTVRKTCHSIAEYRPVGDGTYTNTATVLVSKMPLVVLRSATPVHEVGGAVCGNISEGDISASTLIVNGQELPAEQAGPLLSMGVSALDKVIGHDICTTYSGPNNDLTATATLDGEARPDLTQHVMWVSPADGYRVAP